MTALVPAESRDGDTAARQRAAGGPLPRRLLIIGSGLVGASLGLAARRLGLLVWLDDADPHALALAVARGAGEPVGPGLEPVELAVVATPPSAVAARCVELLRSQPAATVTHVCSVQARPQAEVEAAGVPLDRFLGSHPVAGRELSGPGYADPDLFDGRPWVLCPTASTAASATTSVQALATAVGAQVSTMPAAAHDRLFARLSHLPQLVASALAGTLGGLDAAAVALAGAGLRDTTRLADSTPQLWAQIVGANRDPVATSLDELLARLHELRDQLDRSDADAAEAVAALVRDGRAGRAKLPGKHGGPALAVTAVRVVIPDRPGALADLFGAVAAAEVNLEDIRLEHSPGAATGIAELIVRPDDGGALLAALREGGWTSTSGTAGRL